ncbi:MAG TPA: hypothetical protein PKC98_16125, partial [Candidatus Melainabacteria bacterium]|nr:hypothetical protein [Candidatus Melainabacteria bacterium]
MAESGSMKAERDKQDKVTRLKEARTVFVQTLGLNLLVSFSKLGIGISTNTLSMTADGFHSLLDASSNVLG